MSESEGTTRYTNGIGEGRGGQRLFFFFFLFGWESNKKAESLRRKHIRPRMRRSRLLQVENGNAEAQCELQ